MLDKESETGVMENESGEGMAETEESGAMLMSEIPASRMDEGRIE